MHEWTVWSNWALHFLTHSVVTLTVLGGVAWLGDRLLHRVGPRAQHRMWVAALLLGALLPLLPAMSFAHAAGGEVSAVGGTSATFRLLASTEARWAPSATVCTGLTAAYLLIVLLCMTRLVRRWQRSQTMVRRSSRLLLDDATDALLQRMAERFQVQSPEVRRCDMLQGPAVLGVLRPLLLVPERFVTTDGQDMAAALAHECAHIARRDFAKNLLYEVVAALVAYHPACWWMRRRIAETRELLCDEMAAEAVGDRPEYAASLLRLATAMGRPARQTIHAIGVFDANILEERIMRLTTDVPKVSRTQRTAMGLVMACALLGGAVTAAALPFDVTPQTKGTVYEVGDDVSAPVLEHVVDATFPKNAKGSKKMGWHGTSLIGLIVDSKGMPQKVHVLRSLTPAFDKQAMNAIGQYRFKPGLRKGDAVAVLIAIQVNFRRY